jgi:lysophospholipase
MTAARHGSDESKVLVIYTGGTIGMMLGPSGYRPEPYFLTESLRSQARFHDPHEDSLFSHTGSSQGFREWSSGTGSGSSSPKPGKSQTLPGSTLRVRSSRPINEMPISLVNPAGVTPSFSQPSSSSQTEKDVYEADLPTLVTPRSSVQGAAGKRIRYAVLEVQLTCRSAARVLTLCASGTRYWIAATLRMTVRSYALGHDMHSCFCRLDPDCV